MVTINRETVQFDAVSIAAYGQSALGTLADGWTVNYLGTSASRTVGAIYGTNAELALQLSSLVWDLKELGILP
jgi:hypothetical protein